MWRWFRRTAVGLATAVALLVFYGAAIEPRLLLDERRYRAEIPGLPDQWRGAEVAVFSDLQVGMWLANTGMVAQVVERTVAAEPAAVLLAGDFVYSQSPDVAVQVDTVLERLTPLVDAGIPTFAVLGNHDHAAGAVDELTAGLEQAGVRVLRNESVALPAPGHDNGGPPLHIVGISAKRPGDSDPRRALQEVPDEAGRVVFMHNPASFPELPPNSAPLSVAGHTHCGQIAIPGTPAWSYLQLRADERVVVDGFAPPQYGAEGNRLFVTCGIGFSLAPIRINARPQVVFFELAPA